MNNCHNKILPIKQTMIHNRCFTYDKLVKYACLLNQHTSLFNSKYNFSRISVNYILIEIQYLKFQQYTSAPQQKRTSGAYAKTWTMESMISII